MIKLTEEFSKERGRQFLRLIKRDIEDRSTRLAKIQLARALYYGDKAPVQGPWVGASDVHLPVILEKVEGGVPKCVNAFWGMQPIVQVERVPDEFMPEDTDDTELFFDWSLNSDIADLYLTTENWFRNAFLDGISHVKIFWHRKWRRIVEPWSIKKMWDLGDNDHTGTSVDVPRPKTVLDILTDIFGAPGANNLQKSLLDFNHDPTAEKAQQLTDLGMDPNSPELAMVLDGDSGVGTRWNVSFLENRRSLWATVELESSEFVDEVIARVSRRVMEYDAPKVEVVEYEDLIIPFRALDIQSASRVSQQFWLTIEEIERRAAMGEWDLTEQDLENLRANRTVRQEELPNNRNLAEQKDRVTGTTGGDQREETIDLPEGYAPYNENKVLCFEVYTRDHFPGETESTEVIYQIPYALQKVASARYLDEEFPHGRRPFATLKYQPISGRWDAIGLGENLAPLAIEIDTIINHINNSQELINNPFFFFTPAAMSVTPEVLNGIKPGQGVPVSDINGIVFPKFQQEPLANLSALDSLLLFADRVTMSPMNMGSPQVRNAPRTARGTLAMLSEGNIKTDVLITRWQLTGWTEMVQQLFGLYQKRMPDEKWYYVTGSTQKPVPKRTTPAQIRGRFQFKFAGNSVNTNREVLRGIAQVRYSTIMTHPDYATDPQVRRNALEDFLRHFGEGTDISRLMPAMPGQGAYTHPPMDQKQENQALSQGIMLEVLPTDNHPDHLRIMEEYEKTPQFDLMAPEAVGVYAVHKRGHLQGMQAALAAGGQMQPGMANNIPSENLGTLEGGVQ
jgi:hypothetical protein